MICDKNSIQEYIRSLIIQFEFKGIAQELWVFASLFLILIFISFHVFGTSKFISNRSHLFTTLFFILSFIIILIINVPNLARYSVHINESQHVAEAVALSVDLKFWTSVDGTTIGPLPIYYLTFAELVGFGIDFFSIKILNLTQWFLIIVVLYLVFRLFFSVNSSRLYILPLIVLIAIFKDKDFIAYNGEVLTVLIILLAVYFILKVLHKKTTSPVEIFLIGFFLVLVPFTKFQGGPIAFGLGLFIFWFCIRNNLNVLYLFLGVTIPLIMLILFLSINDSFYDFWQSYILNNFYYASKGEGLESHKGFFFNIAKLILIIFKATETRIIYVLLALISIFFIHRKYVIYGFQGIYAEILQKPKYLFFIILMILTVFVIYIPGNVFVHYSIFLIVPSVLLLGFLFNNLRNSYSDIFNSFSFITLFVILPAINTVFNEQELFSELVQIDKKKYAIHKYICGDSDPGDKIALWGWESGIFPETGLLMGTRESQTQRQLLSWKQQEYYLQRYLKDLKQNTPKYFIDTTKKNDHLLNTEIHHFKNFPRISSFIMSHYRFVMEDDGMYLYERLIPNQY